MGSRTLDDIGLGFIEKACTEFVRGFGAKRERGKNPIWKMPSIVGDDGFGLGGNGCCK